MPIEADALTIRAAMAIARAPVTPFHRWPSLESTLIAQFAMGIAKVESSPITQRER